MEDRYCWKVSSPLNICLYGPSQSGKSEFVLKLVSTPKIWEKPFKNFTYFYGIESNVLEKLKKLIPHGTFIKGLPANLNEMFTQSAEPALVVFDDLSRGTRIY